MRCSSSEVPSVTTARLWVSPRVNSAEPCVRGSTPTSQVIGRMSAGPRPSAREPFSRIMLRTSVYSSEWKISLTCRSRFGSSDLSFSTASFLIASNFSWRADLFGMKMASRICLATRSRTCFFSPSSMCSSGTVRFVLPTLACSSRILATIRLISAWAASIAPSITDSGCSLAPPSTIITASAVPATMRCRSLFSSVARSGLITNWPSTRPTFTPATGPRKGMFDTDSAADAAVMPMTSEVPV